MGERQLVMVDNTVAVLVDSSKALLTREILAHYTPRMSAKYREETAAGRTPDMKEYVTSALKTIGLEHEILPIFAAMSIVADTDASAPAPASEAKPAAGAAQKSPAGGTASRAGGGFQNPMMAGN